MKKHLPILQLLLIVFASFLTFTISANSQTIEETRKKAFELINQNKFFEALPYVEKLVADNPNNATLQYYLGFGFISKTATETNLEVKKAFRLKARAALIKARELGKDDLQMEGLIDSLSVDGTEKGKFSFNPKADKLMDEAESYFAQSKLDEAFDKYQEALEIDPTIYFAALFSGDVFMNKGDFAQAEVWYKKAITINPYIETAYRYSATPLMKQKKYEEAKTRYIEAFITSPYNKLAIAGLSGWGEVTGKQLGHPRFDIPEFKVGADGKTNSTININPGGDDSSTAWIGYTATRSAWYEKTFYEQFPNEPRYRHTLREEVESLKSVVKIANELKAKTKLNTQLGTLIKLDNEGLLEAYVLLARPDNGIARDYFSYLKSNREKLRQYVLNYVIQP